MSAQLFESSPVEPLVVGVHLYPGDTWFREVYVRSVTTQAPVDLSAWVFDARLGEHVGVVDASRSAEGRLAMTFTPEQTADAAWGDVVTLSGTLEGGRRTFLHGSVGAAVGSSIPVGPSQKTRVVQSDVDISVYAAPRGDKGADGTAISQALVEQVQADRNAAGTSAFNAGKSAAAAQSSEGDAKASAEKARAFAAGTVALQDAAVGGLIDGSTLTRQKLVGVTGSFVRSGQENTRRALGSSAVVVPPGTAVLASAAASAWFSATYSAGNRFRLDAPTVFQAASLTAAGTGNIEIGVYAVGRSADPTSVSLAKVATTGIRALSEFTPDGQSGIRVPMQDLIELPPGDYVVTLWCDSTTASFQHGLNNAYKNSHLGGGSFASSFNAATGEALPLFVGSDFPSGRIVGVTLLAARLDPAGKSTLLGDSITNAQTWFDTANGHADRRWTVVNRGVPGETTTQMLARLPAVIADAPGLAVVFGGANDLGRGVAPETIIANLQAMIEGILAGTSARVIVGTVLPRGSVGGDSPVATMNATRAVVNAWIRALTDPRVQVVDWSRAMSTGDDATYKVALFSDHVHPNTRGNRVMGAALAPLV
ncbi:SGNH/GDSL hydrolase family protein [Microbacterium sp. SL75]|uniref:SGNH/GDSL hydrolase family protein n=1 Tax=Microbacterium sp. SL75 TaxID=2995140 RepID=UPI00227148A5|nr:SGNH/GDSL hydrolase family protein [Microbacterium sp. SL75]WAC68893.1 SGNH/GDSL hydrolase family protein [Microbacterium sp. SL75]